MRFITALKRLAAGLLLLPGLAFSQATLGPGGGSGIGGTHAANDVLCSDGSGVPVACATADFYWNSGLFVDGNLTVQDGSGNDIGVFGGSQTLLLRNTLATTGVTLLTLHSGDGQGSDPLLKIINTNDARSLDIDRSGFITRWSDFGSGTQNWILASEFSVGSNFSLRWSSITDADQAKDIGLARDVAGVLRVTDGSTGLGSLLLGTIDAQPGGDVPTCELYTKTAADLTTVSTTEVEVLFALPPRGKVTSVTIKHTTAFSGGSLSAMTVSVGDSVPTPPADATFYSSALDVFAAVSNTAFLDALAYKSSDFSGSDVEAHFTATDDTMDNVSAGAVDFDVCWVVLP